MKWSDTEEISLINVYAPNEREQHPTFWTDLDSERRQKHLPKPDFVLGDFNVTKNAIDRSPPQRNERKNCDQRTEENQNNLEYP